MSVFFETQNFIVESHEKPFVSRTDGGHIRIRIKDESITDRTKLSPAQAIELMRLTLIIGEAMEKGMNKIGIPVIKIKTLATGLIRRGNYHFCISTFSEELRTPLSNRSQNQSIYQIDPLDFMKGLNH